MVIKSPFGTSNNNQSNEQYRKIGSQETKDSNIKIYKTSKLLNTSSKLKK